jgi:hypothetical protein
VRFGIGTRWSAVKDLPAGPVQCLFSVFDDPAKGDSKICEATPASALQAAPVPPPVPAVGTASLTWAAPTKYTDGSALAAVAAYRVYRGPSASSLQRVAEVTGRSATIGSLPSGTHYFAVSAVVGGVESALSAVVSKAIP